MNVKAYPFETKRGKQKIKSLDILFDENLLENLTWNLF